MSNRETIQHIERKSIMFHKELKEINMDEHVDWLIEQAKRADYLHEELKKQKNKYLAAADIICTYIEEERRLEEKVKELEAKVDQHKNYIKSYLQACDEILARRDNPDIVASIAGELKNALEAALKDE